MSQERRNNPNDSHRHNLPFVFMDVLEVGSDPLVFPLVVGRGFLLELATSDGGRGAASFITIFAWISSSFEALTFLGQNSVTKLRKSQTPQILIDYIHVRPKMPTPPFSIFTGGLLGLQYEFDSSTNGSKGVLQDRNLVVSRHIFSR